jgi:hypothetical protein
MSFRFLGPLPDMTFSSVHSSSSTIKPIIQAHQIKAFRVVIYYRTIIYRPEDYIEGQEMRRGGGDWTAMARYSYSAHLASILGPIILPGIATFLHRASTTTTLSLLFFASRYI